MKKRNILSYFPVRFGWVVSENEKSKKAFLDNTTLLTHPSPTWFRISKDGTILGTVDKEIINVSREHGLILSPLVSNTIPNKGFSAELFHEFITNENAKMRFIHELTTLYAKYDIRGLNIDFEYFLPSDEPFFVHFLELLKEKLPDVILSVDLPPVVDTAGTAWTYQIDCSRIAATADYLVFMMYDYSWPKSNPGPICPLSWLNENVKKIKELVPRDKIVIGLPLYGYDWSYGYATGISSNDAEEIAKKFHSTGKIKTDIDKRSLERFFEYVDDRDGRHIIYYQTNNAIVKRLEFLQKEQILGISFWYWGAAPVKWFFYD